MPTLKLEKAMKASADRVLAALARVDQFQNFIPGCAESRICSCETPEENVWAGTARCTFELKKIDVHEQADVQYRIDQSGMSVRYTILETTQSAFSADARYQVVAKAPERCSLELKLEYAIPRKNFVQMIAKPLIGRVFAKFTKLLEQRALQTDLSIALMAQPVSDASLGDTVHRGFMQQDQRSYEARMKLLKRLPKGSTGAEIGTYMGAFASQIVEHVQPKTLYLIDPWIAQFSEDQVGSWYETVEQDYMDSVHDMVKQRFSDLNGPTDIIILRDYSSSALATLPDGCLDWCYIDGDHAYPAVRNDLELGFAKVRSGGFISGDDHEIVDQWWKDNVVRAVREFVDAYPVDFVMNEGAQFLLLKR